VRWMLPPDASGQPKSFRFLGRLHEGITDYWDGE